MAAEPRTGSVKILKQFGIILSKKHVTWQRRLLGSWRPENNETQFLAICSQKTQNAGRIMKKTLPQLIQFSVLLLLIGASTTARAQIAYWTNSLGGEWNTAANWDVDNLGINVVPGEGTNADIGTVATATVNYDLPMAPTSFGLLNIAPSSVLNVNTNGFNLNGNGTGTALITVGGVINVGPNGVLLASNGGPVTVLDTWALNIAGQANVSTVTATATNAPLAITASGRLTISNNGTLKIFNSGRISLVTSNSFSVEGGTFIMTNNPPDVSGINFGANGNNNGAGFTNNGGTIILDQRFEMRGRFSRFIMNGGTLRLASQNATNGIFEGANDLERQWLINGGVADMGDFVISRTLPGPGAGLVVSNGVVTVTSLRVGTGASRAFAYVGGGVLTNTGTFTIGDRTNAAVTGERRVQFLIRGGSVVSTVSEGIFIPSQSNGPTNLVQTAAVLGSILDINAGSLMAEKINLIRDNTQTNSHATILLSGSGIIYLGSGGLVANAGPTNTSVTVTVSGGTFAAKANHSINANMTLSGISPTFRAADAAGNPFNITHSGVISGSGNLNKTGGGILTLTTNDTYSGNTIISGGTLVLSSSGSISNTPQIVLSNNANFDVSAVASARLVGSQTLSGQGAVLGNLLAQSGTTIRPGGSVAIGTLSFSNSLTESGSVLNSLDLSTNSAIGSNDLIQIAGDLIVSGTNTIQINALNGQLPTNSVYTLIRYGGNFVGGLTNFALSGAQASLSNDVAGKSIQMVITTGIRGPTSVTWLGSAANSNWDMLLSSNWLNGVSRDVFVSGDNALFSNLGATNPTVNVVGSILPGSMTVDSSSNYTFAGSGSIDGTSGLIKTNSGTLTILTTNNNFPGAVVIAGGTLEAAKLASGGAPSSIGTASADPSNVQLGTRLRYIGPSTSTDRGVTLNTTGAAIDVASNTLTMSGTLPGVGGLTKTGPGTLILSGTASYVDVTTVSNGVLQINSSALALATNEVNLAGGTLFLNVGGGQNLYSNKVNVLAQSGINVGGQNVVFLAADTWTGNNILNANVNSGGFFTFNSPIGFTGTLQLGNSAGLFRFNSGGNATGPQQCSGSALIAFDVGTNTAAVVNRNGGGISFGTYFLGALSGGPNTQLRGSENGGSTSTYQIGDLNVNTTFAGSIRNGHAGVGSPQLAAAVSIVKVGTGTLTLSGTNIHSGSTTVSNGVLALSGFGSIGSSTTISVFSNTVLDVSARSDGTLTLNTNQTLRGSGTVNGSVTAGNGAAVTVGDTDGVPDAMTISNVLVFQTGSTLNMDLDQFQFAVGRTNDVIQGLSSVTYGGTLNLTILSIETNSVFKLFSAGSYSGAFDGIVPSTPFLLGPQWGWDTSFLAVDGTLRISTLHPKIIGITVSGSDLIIDGTDGIPGSDYYVLSSTNLTLPISQWTPILTNNVGSATFQITLTGEFNSGAPQRFYLLKLAQ
jgi:autotransporter-associated beta strand protein